MVIDRLRERFHELHEVKGALAVLGDRPLAAKRAEVYPVIVALLVEALCEAPRRSRGAPSRCCTSSTASSPHEPDLAAQLYAAIGEATVRHLAPELFRFITAARDPRGVPLLRGGSTIDGWVDAVVALRGSELLDEIVDALDDEPTRELAAAVAIVGGEARRADLERRPDGAGAGTLAARAIGLALLGSPGDKAFFAGLGNFPDQTTARRIHPALAARGPKQRMDALDELSAGVADAATPFGAERLLAFTLAIGDRRPDVAERASRRARRLRQDPPRRAAPAAPRAVPRARRPGRRGRRHRGGPGLPRDRARHDPAGRAVRRRAGGRAAASRTAAARARGKEMVESLDATLAPTAGSPSAERRDPALEAVIAANPDDREAYLVYADWLQGVGDARGAWITLHARSSLAAREASAVFLAEHRATLLGPLAPYVASADGGDDAPLELEVVHGLRPARDLPSGAGRRRPQAVRAATDTALRALAALLDAACGAFVQEARVRRRRRRARRDRAAPRAAPADADAARLRHGRRRARRARAGDPAARARSAGPVGRRARAPRRGARDQARA